MEQQDLALINDLIHTNETLRRLMEEHEFFEDRLMRYDQKEYLTPAEEIERKRVQKLKLRGRDQIERILARTRSAGRTQHPG
jgi:uncharacterized protein YdcH (DUF465 family)